MAFGCGDSRVASLYTRPVMFPQTLFELAGYPVNSYMLAYLLGIVPALILGLNLAQRRGISLEFSLDSALLVLGMAYVGSRILFAIQWYFASLPGVDLTFRTLLFGGGQASMGALTAVLGALYLFFVLHPLVGYPLGGMDLVVTSASLYQGIARLGCFAQGCCHGSEAEGLPWAVTHTDPRSACGLLGVPLHPAQIYLVIGNLALSGVLVSLALRPDRFRGMLLGIYLIAYGTLRFVVEFFRSDLRPVVGWLTLNQWICIVFFLVGAALMAYRRTHPPQIPIPAKGN